MPALSIEKVNAFVQIVDWMINAGQKHVEGYVGKMRRLNPGISDADLAKKIVRRKSMKNGLVGAVTGLGGMITLPVTVPADLAASWKIQIFMALAVAHVYGHNQRTMDARTDVYLILAGDSAKEALKNVGVEVGKSVTKMAVDKYVTREVMKKIWKYIPRKIITKAGEKSMTSFTRMVPLVGAPIGFAADLLAAMGAGKIAIHYYSGGG